MTGNNPLHSHFFVEVRTYAKKCRQYYALPLGMQVCLRFIDKNGHLSLFWSALLFGLNLVLFPCPDQQVSKSNNPPYTGRLE